jgi:hypothetical protein
MRALGWMPGDPMHSADKMNEEFNRIYDQHNGSISSTNLKEQP